MTTDEWYGGVTAALLAESPFRRSDYFRRFASGTLTKARVWGHIAQHYLLIAWFPRIFSGIHTRCEDLEVRKDCARHLLVEDLGYFEGRVGGTPDHDELFRRIGDDLGYARDEYARIVPVPEMAAIVAFFRRLAHDVPWSASLCATALLEEEVVEIARTVGKALVQHYGVRADWGAANYPAHEATARAATRRGAHHGAGGRPRSAPRPEPPGVPGQQRRHGRGLPRHERRLRSRLRRLPRRGPATRCGGAARRRAGRTVHHRRADALRPRRLQAGGAARPREVRQEELEPRARRRERPRALQVRELPARDLRGQRHESGAPLGRAVRRPDLGPADQRPDRGRACRHQSHRRLAADAGPRRLHAQEERLDGRGGPRDRRAEARQLEGLHDRGPALPVEGRLVLAARRYEADVPVLREDREVRHQHRVHPQGPAAARLREVVAQRLAVRDGGRSRQGRQGLAADQLRDLPLGAPRVPRAAGRGRSEEHTSE